MFQEFQTHEFLEMQSQFDNSTIYETVFAPDSEIWNNLYAVLFASKRLSV